MTALGECVICRQIVPLSMQARPDLRQCKSCVRRREVVRYGFLINDPSWAEKERIRNAVKMRKKRADPKSSAQERARDLAYKRIKWRTDPEFRAGRKAYKATKYATDPAFRARVNARNLAWNKTPKGLHCATVRRARERDNAARLTLPEWQLIISMQENRCACCSAPFGEQNKPTRDHIVSVKDGGMLTFGNTQALCKSCNSRKGARSIDYRQRKHA